MPTREAPPEEPVDHGDPRRAARGWKRRESPPPDLGSEVAQQALEAGRVHGNGGDRTKRRHAPIFVLFSPLVNQAEDCSNTASNSLRRGCPTSTPSGVRVWPCALRNASERVHASNAARLSQAECEMYTPGSSPRSSAKPRKPGTSSRYDLRRRQCSSNSPARSGLTSNWFIAMNSAISILSFCG